MALKEYLSSSLGSVAMTRKHAAVVLYETVSGGAGLPLRGPSQEKGQHQHADAEERVGGN